MRFKEISESSTTAGSVATVPHAFVKMKSRNPSVYGDQKVGNLLTGKKTSKPFANSVNESAGINEADLQEDDIIVVPGQGRLKKTGFVPHGQSRVDHEVEMARSDLISSAKNAKEIFELIQSVSEDEGLEGWVQEKIIKANDYLNTVREYLEGKQYQQESIEEGAKVDRMVKHIEKSEKKLGKSDKEAENIAWATANKRGMLDNKNKKK